MFYVLYMMLFVKHASEGMASFLIIIVSTLMEIGIVPSHCIPLHLAISYQWNSLDLHKIAFDIRQTNYPNKWIKKKRKENIMPKVPDIPVNQPKRRKERYISMSK